MVATTVSLVSTAAQVARVLTSYLLPGPDFQFARWPPRLLRRQYGPDGLSHLANSVTSVTSAPRDILRNHPQRTSPLICAPEGPAGLSKCKTNWNSLVCAGGPRPLRPDAQMQIAAMLTIGFGCRTRRATPIRQTVVQRLVEAAAAEKDQAWKGALAQHSTISVAAAKGGIKMCGSSNGGGASGTKIVLAHNALRSPSQQHDLSYTSRCHNQRTLQLAVGASCTEKMGQTNILVSPPVLPRCPCPVLPSRLHSDGRGFLPFFRVLLVTNMARESSSALR